MSTLYPSGLHYCKEQSGVCDNYEQVVFEIAAAGVCNLQISVALSSMVCDRCLFQLMIYRGGIFSLALSARNEI